MASVTPPKVRVFSVASKLASTASPVSLRVTSKVGGEAEASLTLTS